MIESYSFLRILDEGKGIVYTFSNEKYGYTIYFNDSVYKDLLEGCKLLSQGSYSFGFFNTDIAPDERKKGDPRIGVTMSKIIEDFFQADGKNSIVLFHCDGTDSMGLHRHKTFSRWYRDSEIKEVVTMYQIEIEVENETHYLGFICHNENTNIEEIKMEFDSVAQNLTPEAQKK